MRKSLMVAALVAVAGVGVYRWRSSEPDAAQSAAEHEARLLKDRLWIDHVPRHDRDTIQVFLLFTKPPRQGPSGPFGVFETGSVWQGGFKAFRYESQGQELRVIFPQTNA